MDPAAQELITRHNEQVRELIVRDIDALEDKLNVKRQVSMKADRALDKLKGTLGMNQRNQGEGWASVVRQNAAPLAAIGAGGALLAKNLRERNGSSNTQTTSTRLVSEASYVPPSSGSEGEGGLKDRATSKAGEIQSAASEGVDTAREKVTEATDTAKLRMGDAKESVVENVATARTAVTEQAVHAREVVVEHIPTREQASRAAHDHSQLLGLAALAAGAAAGTFVPRTRAEERRLAPVQAQVKEKASELGEKSVEKAKETADRAAEALSAGAETAKEEFADSGEEPPSGELPDVTRSNRITGGTRTGAASGTNGTSGSY